MENEEDSSDRETDGGDPEFSIVEIDAPEEVAIGEEFTYSITVENTGGADGVWAQTVMAKEPDGQWQSAPLELEVPAGETKTWESDTVTVNYTTQLLFRLDEADVEFSIRFVSATLGFGEEYVSPDGMAFTVDSIEFFDSYTWSGSSGNTYEEQAPAGKKWAKVYVVAENKGSEQAYSPFASDVSIIADNSQYDNTYISNDEGEYEHSEIAPGIVREGWIVYELPEDLSKDDFRVQWADDNFEGSWTVYWTASP